MHRSMSGVLPRCFRGFRGKPHGIPLQLICDNDSIAQRLQHVSTRPPLPKKAEKSSYSFRKRGKSPPRKRNDITQDRAYSYNVPAIYRRPTDDADQHHSVTTGVEQAAIIDIKRQRMQSECYALLLDYQHELYSSEPTNDETSSASPLNGIEVATIQLLVDTLSTHSETPKMSDLHNTELRFKNICMKLQDLIRTVVAVSSGDAEAFLRILIQLRSHRVAMLDKASRNVDENDETRSWGELISRAFVPSQIDAPVGSALTAHFDASFGPNSSLFGLLLDRIAHEAQARNENALPGTHDQTCANIDAAERMIRLIELIPSCGHEVSSQLLCHVLSVYESDGTMVAARKAEKFYNDHCKNTSTWHTAKAVLRTYLAAAKEIEDSPNIHTEIAKMASDIVLNTEIKTAESFTQRISVNASALQCLQVSAQAIVPADQCLLADAIVKKCVGKRDFRDFFFLDRVRPDSKYGMLIHHLLSIYAMSRDETRLVHAMVLLTYLETTTEKGGVRYARRSQPPFLDSYIAVLTGIHKSRYVEGTVDKNGDSVKRAMFAQGMLDRMIAQGLWPNNNVFDLLFEICASVDMNDAGEQTEMLLRRMVLRAVFDSDICVTTKHYNQAIHAWGISANHAFPGVAERAEQLLRKMEIQSGVSCGHVFAESFDDEGVQEPHATVYNRNVVPDTTTYANFFRTCSMVQIDEEKQRTLEIVLDTIDRMEAFGIQQSDDICNYAILSCKNLCMAPGQQISESVVLWLRTQKKSKLSSDVAKTFRELIYN